MGVSCRQCVFDQSACSDEATNHHLFVCVCVVDLQAEIACCFPPMRCIYVFSTISGLGLDLHQMINRKSNDFSEMDRSSYSDSLTQPPACSEEM